jgi:DNA replicative helicase MCM subunit Mcm2 (Cdc46/Mcm family)
MSYSKKFETIKYWVDLLTEKYDLVKYLAGKYMVPELEGHVDVKEGLLLQLVNEIDAVDGFRDRIHVALIGYPGTGKTLAMAWISKFFDAIYLTGEDLRSSSLKGDARRKDLGAQILLKAHRKILIIDEIELFPDKDSLRSVMENGWFIFAKGGREERFETQVRVIGGANELKGFSRAMLSRFDFVYEFERPTKDQAKAIAKKIVRLRAGLMDYDLSWFREYVRFVKTHQSVIPESEVPRIESVFEKYFDLTGVGKEGRWIDSVLRAATAIAKLHLRDVKAEDVVRALMIKDKTMDAEMVEVLLE